MKKILLSAALAVATFMGVQAQTVKIGVVDSQTVLTALPEASVLESELAKRTQTFQNQMKEFETELQGKYADYLQKRDSLDDITRQMKEEEIQGIQQKAETYQQAQYRAISEYREQQIGMMQDKVVKAMKAVGDREQYTMIFTLGDAAYFSPTLTEDITEKVKKELNIK